MGCHDNVDTNPANHNIPDMMQATCKLPFALLAS